MATLYITEFQNLTGMLQAASAVPLLNQTVAIGGASAQSSTFNGGTGMVRLHTDTICSVLFGINPIATTATQRMAAGQTEYFAVGPGLKVAVIANT